MYKWQTIWCSVLTFVQYILPRDDGKDRKIIRLNLQLQSTTPMLSYILILRLVDSPFYVWSKRHTKYHEHVSVGKKKGLTNEVVSFRLRTQLNVMHGHARIQKVLSEGVHLWQSSFNFSLMREEWSKKHYKQAIIDPAAKRHLNGVSLACRLWPNIECWLVNFTILRGFGPVLLKTLYFCELPGGVQKVL